MNTSIQESPTLLERLRELSESPWFWLLLFVNAAIVGMLLIAPKYRQRQAVLERRYEARREIALRQAAGARAVESSGAAADPQARDRELLVPLWRLLLTLVAIDLAGVAVFLWHRHRKFASHPAKPSSA